MQLSLYIVDAFTLNERPFSGNPAAVCFLEFDDDITDEAKQQIASEINLSETAFISKAWVKGLKLDSNVYTLRWFTPKTEVELCGHATLGAARAIFEQCLKDSDNSLHTIKFETKFKGTLEAVINSSEQFITLDFPVIDYKKLDNKSNPWVDDIVKYTLGPNLNVKLVEDIQYSPALKYLTLRLANTPESDLISKLLPNMQQLLKIDTKNSIIAVMVTQKAGIENSADFLVRFFAPWVGIDEDPVTGSAYSILTPYWKRLLNGSGVQTTKLIAEQCSQRGGSIVCELVGDRVKISGKSKLFVSGFMTN